MDAAVHPDQGRVSLRAALHERLEEVRGNLEVADRALVRHFLVIDDALAQLGVPGVGGYARVDIALEVCAEGLVLRVLRHVELARAVRVHDGLWARRARGGRGLAGGGRGLPGSGLPGRRRRLWRGLPGGGCRGSWRCLRRRCGLGGHRDGGDGGQCDGGQRESVRNGHESLLERVPANYTRRAADGVRLDVCDGGARADTCDNPGFHQVSDRV